MKNKLLIIVLAVLAPLTADARIGETKKQCQVRYGNPTSITGNVSTYKKGNFGITAQFDNYGKVSILIIDGVHRSKIRTLLNASFPDYKFQWSMKLFGDAARYINTRNDVAVFDGNGKLTMVTASAIQKASKEEKLSLQGM